MSSSIGVGQRILDPSAFQDLVKKTIEVGLRVSTPGIIRGFDPVELTVQVQPAILEEVQPAGIEEPRLVPLPLLYDVPILFQTAGGYSITLPIALGDECLVVFGDQCMDGWWQSGGLQPEVDKRRHDLSDGYAIVGVRSRPRPLSNYSTDSIQVRNDEGSAYLEIKGDNITLVGTALEMRFDTITSTSTSFTKTNQIDVTNTVGYSVNASGFSTMEGSGVISIGSNRNTRIDGKVYVEHTHSGVESGLSDTGGVVG